MAIRSRFIRFSLALHLGAAVALWALPSQWPLILSVIVMDHLVVVWGSLWPRSRIVGPNLRRLPGGPEALRVALTFDDGPDPEVTPEVLRILGEHGARATFFCIGERAEAHPELVAQMVAEGHTVENHTQRHSNLFCFFLPHAMGREIDRAQKALARAAGTAPLFFRAPAGLRNPWLDPLLAARGLSLVSWTRRSFDTVARDPQRILERLATPMKAGDILVLHDGRSARTEAGKPVVVELLGPLLEELGRRNLISVALPGHDGETNARSSPEVAIPSS